MVKETTALVMQHQRGRDQSVRGGEKERAHERACVGEREREIVITRERNKRNKRNKKKKKDNCE